MSLKLRSARRSSIYLFFVLLITGTIISTLGSISLPIGGQISRFWPGVVIQALGGMWFGLTGVCVGVLFPVFSRAILGGVHDTLYYVPVNLAQTLLPLLLYRHFKREPKARTISEGLFYLAVICVSAFVAGVVRTASFSIVGARAFEHGSFLADSLYWSAIQARTLILIGLPLMIWFAPKVMEVNLVEMYWSKADTNRLQRALAVKIFVVLGLVTVFPLVIVGLYQMLTLNRIEILRPNYLAIALNLTFFSLLIISAFLSDLLYRPIKLLTDRVAELSRRHELPDSLLLSADESTFYEGLIVQVEALLENCRRLEREKVVSETAAQVAHDIRAPLAALEAAIRDSTGPGGEARNLILGAVSRIKEIAEDLVKEKRECAGAKFAAMNIAGLVTDLVAEKRLRFRARSRLLIECTILAAEAEAMVSENELKRALSNIVENSAEAIGTRKGRISITLRSSSGQVAVDVVDDGPGVSPEVLLKMGERGFTEGKPDGSGLGLSHAKRVVEGWGGRLEMSSDLGKGTKVSVILPLVERKPMPGATCDAVLIDDNPLAHKTWLVAAERAGKRLRVYSSAADFVRELSIHRRETPIYIDVDLANGESGETASWEIYEAGFREIYLATGREPEKFVGLKYLRGVVGKTPPWL